MRRASADGQDVVTRGTATTVAGDAARKQVETIATVARGAAWRWFRPDLRRGRRF